MTAKSRLKNSLQACYVDRGQVTSVHRTEPRAWIPKIIMHMGFPPTYASIQAAGLGIERVPILL